MRTFTTLLTLCCALLVSTSRAGVPPHPQTILPVFDTAAYCAHLAQEAGDPAVGPACLDLEHESFTKMEAMRIPASVLLQCLHYVGNLAEGDGGGHRSYNILFACVRGDTKS